VGGGSSAAMGQPLKTKIVHHHGAPHPGGERASTMVRLM
jgi:hypothetical protein